MAASPNWTPDEIYQLQDLWGDYSIPAIAKRLGRSVNAVKIKAIKLGLGGNRNSGALLSFSELLKAIGQFHNYSYLKTRLVRDGFPVKRKKVENCSFLMVDIDDFWKWMDTHRDALDFSQFEELALGKEPEWVKEKRRADFLAAHRFKKTLWTDAEDKALVRMLEQKKHTYQDISTALCRTEGAIKRRISTLCLDIKPLRNKPKPWTPDEEAILIRLKQQGYDYEYIGEKLHRTALACRGRLERFSNPDYYERNNRRARAEGEDYQWTSASEFLAAMQKEGSHG